MQLSWLYKKHESAWGPPTSTNFCEEDFYLSPYIAEFVNTITNLSYVAYAIHGFYHGGNQGRMSPLALPYLGLSFVGFGSMLFHASLKLELQFVDDLSMVYTTVIVFHAAYTTHSSGYFRRWSAAVLMLLTTLFTYRHVTKTSILLHQVVFSSMLGPIYFRCRYLISKLPNQKAQKSLKRLSSVGAVTFVGGFLLWLLDHRYCDTLRNFRHQVGLPWGTVTELHGWWHILTAVGVHTYMVLVEYLQLEAVLRGKDETVVLEYERFLGFPVIPQVRRRKDKSS